MHLSFGRKTACALGLGALAALVLGLTAIRAISTLGDELRSVSVDGARINQNLTRLRSGIQTMRAEACSAQLLFAIRKLESGDAKGTCSACHDVTQAGRVSQALAREAAELQQVLSDLRPGMPGASAATALKAVDSGLRDWLRIWERFLPTAQASRYEEAHEILVAELLPIISGVEKSAEVLLTNQKAAVQNAASRTEVTTRNQARTALFMAVLAVLVNALIFWQIMRAIRRLGEVGRGIVHATGTVQATAEQLNGCSVELTDDAQRQAAMLRQTGAAGARIAECASANVRYSSEADRLVASVLQTSGQVRQSLADLSATMDTALKTGEKVASIAKNVEEIALQTNLLALNASVEAARAGAVGAGFAIVADEVRSLAQRCSEAARETTQLMQTSAAGAADGRAAVARVSDGVHRVTEAANALNCVMDRVRAGCNDQEGQVRDVSGALEDLTSVTDRIMSAAHGSRERGRNLAAESGDLDRITERLDAMFQGR